MIFSTCYALWLYNKIFSGLLITFLIELKSNLGLGFNFSTLNISRNFLLNFTDLNLREFFSLIYLILPVIYFGLNPSTIIDLIEYKFIFFLTSKN